MNQFSSSTTVRTRLQTVAHSGGVPWWKRALDITLILLAMPVLLPICLFVAAIVKLVSPGPVFFQQERVGYRGRRFMCFKFRTMMVNACTAMHQEHLEELMTSNRPMSKLDAQDPRVIPGGSWLRA